MDWERKARLLEERMMRTRTATLAVCRLLRALADDLDMESTPPSYVGFEGLREAFRSMPVEQQEATRAAWDVLIEEASDDE